MEPVTRKQSIIAGKEIPPRTREEQILAGREVASRNRNEFFLEELAAGGGGGGDVTIEKGTFTLATIDGESYHWVNFENTHNTAPDVVVSCIVPTGGFSTYPNSDPFAQALVNINSVLGITLETKSSSPYHADAIGGRVTKGSSSLSGQYWYTATDSATKWSTYATNEKMRVEGANPGTYKWAAIWLNDVAPEPDEPEEPIT